MVAEVTVVDWVEVGLAVLHQGKLHVITWHSSVTINCSNTISACCVFKGNMLNHSVQLLTLWLQDWTSTQSTCKPYLQHNACKPNTPYVVVVDCMVVG